MIRYPVQQLYQELAFIAFHLHWDLATLLELDHAERRRWVAEVSAINERLSAQTDR
ncbi:MAG: DUF6760 family protein [Chloroflexota bacterium]